MKELITEEGADLVILILAVAVALGGLGWGFAQSRVVPRSEKKILWIKAVLCSLLGPVIWCFWEIYNSIENHYGLDSLKALKINFFIAVGIAAVFAFLFAFVPKWVAKTQGSRNSK